jgi:hypothetical protein
MSNVERVVICPKCGEDNPENFKFCGMCGTPLGQKVESRRPAGAPVPNLPPVNRPLETPVFTRAEQQAQTVEPRRPAGSPMKTLGAAMNEPLNAPSVTRPATTAPTISGPSLLGLDRPMTVESDSPRAAGAETRQNEYGPTPDLLREKSFSGLDSFFEPEEPKGGAGRLILFFVLVAALGGAGWWTYTNYLATTGTKPAASTPVAGNPADNSAQTNAPASAPEPNGTPQNSPQASTPPAANLAQETNQGLPSNASSTGADKAGNPGAATPSTANSAASSSPAAGETATPKTTPSEPTPSAREEARAQARSQAEERRQARLEASAKPAPARPSPITEAAAPSGDADFRKGEAYLYGRGAAQNCGEAIRYLKSAAAVQSAKARSTFGTMYATGHCVNRDLPTSYQWFAMALQLDPNNKILQEDLNAIWNQMTPPERQSATRAKQQ